MKKMIIIGAAVLATITAVAVTAFNCNDCPLCCGDGNCPQDICCKK